MPAISIDDIQAASTQIIDLCRTPHTALEAIHLIIRTQGASIHAWQALHQRIITDSDANGAYYLVSFAQKIDDLPFDALPLVELIMAHGSDELKQATLKKLPKAAKAHLISLGLIGDT